MIFSENRFPLFRIIQPKAVDWCRGIDGANATQLDTRPLEATLLQHATRRRVADPRPRLQRLMAELAEAVIDHGANCFGRVASVPERHADPIAELSSVRSRIDAARTDHRAIKHDGECRAAALTIRFGEEAFAVGRGIGMRNPRGVLGDPAVAGQFDHCRHVARRRCAQQKPLGFEHRKLVRIHLSRPAWRKSGDWKFCCERHCWAPARNGKGSRHAGLPFFEPLGPTGSTGCRRTSYDPPFTGPRPHSSNVPRRKRGLWFWYETQVCRRSWQERVILADAHIASGMPFGAALA